MHPCARRACYTTVAPGGRGAEVGRLATDVKAPGRRPSPSAGGVDQVGQANKRCPSELKGECSIVLPWPRQFGLSPALLSAASCRRRVKTGHSAPVENWTLIGQEATGDEALA